MERLGVAGVIVLGDGKTDGDGPVGGGSQHSLVRAGSPV